jgi:hypothetical protein
MASEEPARSVQDGDRRLHAFEAYGCGERAQCEQTKRAAVAARQPTIARGTTHRQPMAVGSQHCHPGPRALSLAQAGVSAPRVSLGHRGQLAGADALGTVGSVRLAPPGAGRAVWDTVTCRSGMSHAGKNDCFYRTRRCNSLANRSCSPRSRCLASRRSRGGDLVEEGRLADAGVDEMDVLLEGVGR